MGKRYVNVLRAETHKPRKKIHGEFANNFDKKKNGVCFQVETLLAQLHTLQHCNNTSTSLWIFPCNYHSSTPLTLLLFLSPYLRCTSSLLA